LCSGQTGTDYKMGFFMVGMQVGEDVPHVRE